MPIKELEVPLAEKDAAPYVGTTRGNLRKMRSQGRGPVYIKLGRRVMYLPSDLRAYIDSNRRVFGKK